MGDYYTDWWKKTGVEQPGSSSNSQFQNYLSSGVTGMLEQSGFKEPDKYSQFITEYDPSKEIVAGRNYDTQMKQFGVQRNTLSKNYSNQLMGLFGQTESAQAKGGFAGSGAINRASGLSRGNLGFEYMSGVKGLNLEKEGAATSLWGSVEGSRSDYMNNLYEQMTNLLEGGAKTYEKGDTKKDSEGNTWTYSKGKWVISGVPSGGAESWDNPGPGNIPSEFRLGSGTHNVGDTTVYGGKTYTWNGTGWVDEDGNPYGATTYPNPFN